MAVTTALAALSFGASIFQAIGQKKEGDAEGQTQELNAQLARGDAQITQADIKISQAKRNLERGREQTTLKRFVSTQDALYAKAGVTLSGSPIAVIEETTAEGELDIIINDINARMEQTELQRQADSLEIEALQRETAADRARSTGRTRAGLTLLTSGTKFASNFFEPKDDS